MNSMQTEKDNLRKSQAISSSLIPIEKIEKDLSSIDKVKNILELSEKEFPHFTLAKNKARFLRMFNWYKTKEQWLKISPLSGTLKLFRQQTKELESIRSNKLEYEMELETKDLTLNQRAYRFDELKMCKVHEKMAVNLISKMQLKIRSSRP